MTRNGICYDLKESPYFIECKLYNVTRRFYFSSVLYQDKFLVEHLAYREEVSKSLSNRFGLKIQAYSIADIALYAKIEKRGFYYTENGVAREWLHAETINC